MQDIDKLIQQIPILKSNQHYRVGDIINRHGLGRSENSRVHILHNKEFKGSILRDYLNEISTDEFKKIPLSETQSCKKFLPFTGKFIDHSKERDHKLLAGIVKKQSNQYLLPVATELCIHLRAGDVLVLGPGEQSALEGKFDLYLLPQNQEKGTLIDLIRKKINSPPLAKYPKPVPPVPPDPLVPNNYANECLNRGSMSLGDPANINSITFVTAMHFGDHPWSGDFNYSGEKLEANLKLYRQLFSSVIEEFPSLKIQILDHARLQGYHRIDYPICYLCNAPHLIADTGGFSRQIQFIRNELINE